ncbi:hypothetical protein LTR17_001065 [Elasticomyces elasticus]|nr:hypothetical protein LTR17_001065 [Elasticomyces elasticus]
MDPSGTPRAVSNVIGTPELLEAILLLLVQGPLHLKNNYAWHQEQGKRLAAVLCSQRVNKAFLNTIIGSPSLQRALFFASTPEQTLVRKHCNLNSMLEQFEASVIIKGSERKIFLTWFGVCGPSCEHKLLLVDRGVPDESSADIHHFEGTESWRRMRVTSAFGRLVGFSLPFSQPSPQSGDIALVASDTTVGEFMNRCITLLD